MFGVNNFVEEYIRQGGKLSDTLKTVLLRTVQGGAPSASVKAGLPEARRAGKPGRPRKQLDREAIVTFRKAGRSWSWIGKKLGVRAKTARRAVNEPI